MPYVKIELMKKIVDLIIGILAIEDKLSYAITLLIILSSLITYITKELQKML